MWIGTVHGAKAVQGPEGRLGEEMGSMFTWEQESRREPQGVQRLVSGISVPLCHIGALGAWSLSQLHSP